ncbi:hypothetical protein V1498_13220 [Peribacillus sp. SCS-26]|uniref:hypothetical protein n=1 Tax=Paraperibacillus marinus TaxID=3115295 RepID=UPI003906AF0C
MAGIASLRIDGEEIMVFNASIYIFKSSGGYSLELECVVGEITATKYEKVENMIVEIELTNGSYLNTIMHKGNGKGRLPRLHIYCELDDPDEYKGIPVIDENEADFPDIDEGLSLAEIREYEMPMVKVKLAAVLPINQAEWLGKLKKKELEAFLTEAVSQGMKNG